MFATHACTCIHGCADVCTQSHKHKHTNTVAVPPTCFVIEQTSPPITITGPDLYHKRQEGPNPAAPWSGQKPAGEWEKQVEGGEARRKREHLPSGSEQWTEERCSSSKRLSELCEASESKFSWSEPGCSISGSRHARSSLWRSRQWGLYKRTAEGCFMMRGKEIIQGRPLLLLFDGLNSFHQVLLSLCVWVQRLFLRHHAELRTCLLVHLWKIQHRTLMSQVKNEHYAIVTEILLFI